MEVARAVGAEFNLRAVLAEPEDFHDSSFDFKPTMVRRWFSFRRRPQLREVAIAFYSQTTKHSLIASLGIL